MLSLTSALAYSQEKTALDISAYGDVYAAGDLGDAAVGTLRQVYFYNHAVAKQLSLNQALVKLSVTENRFRANLGVHQGTYVVRNYAAEPRWAKPIYEANVGLALGKGWWVDAGIFGSHIGFESALSIDNPTLTRSLCAENSPYYSAGADLTYAGSEKWNASVLVLNGWQQIAGKGTDWPALGTQFTLTPSENTTFNWSTYAGQELGVADAYRLFNHLYWMHHAGQWQYVAGFDLGYRYLTTGVATKPWHTAVAIVHWQFLPRWETSARAEYFSDPQGILLPLYNTPNYEPTLGGGSLMAGYSPRPDAAVRLEVRYLASNENSFTTGGGTINTNLSATASIAFRLQGKLNP